MSTAKCAVPRRFDTDQLWRVMNSSVRVSPSSDQLAHALA
jgi:hypothetical protein